MIGAKPELFGVPATEAILEEELTEASAVAGSKLEAVLLGGFVSSVSDIGSPITADVDAMDEELESPLGPFGKGGDASDEWSGALA